MKKIIILLALMPLYMFGQAKVIEPELVDSQTLEPSRYTNTILHKGLLYFIADDSVHGEEIWTFDGTMNSVKMLKDINPTGDSRVQLISNELDDYILFTAYNNKEGDFGLWSTDGTEQGTRLLQKMNYILGDERTDLVQPGTNFIKHGSKIYFVASLGQLTEYDIWETDGTPEGTKIWMDLDSVYNFRSSVLTKFDDKLLIRFVSTGSENYEGLFNLDTDNNKLIRLADSRVGYIKSVNEDYYFVRKREVLF